MLEWGYSFEIHMGDFKGWAFNETTQAEFLKNTFSLCW